MEVKIVKDTTLTLRNAGEVCMLVCLVFLAKEGAHWLKVFWKWGPGTVTLSHSQELRETAGQQEMALTTFFFLRRKQRCLRYGPLTLAGGSDKTSSLGCPMHAAAPAEYKDTPLGSCWVQMRKDQCCVATSTHILPELQEMVWLTCQVISCINLKLVFRLDSVNPIHVWKCPSRWKGRASKLQDTKFPSDWWWAMPCFSLFFLHKRLERKSKCYIGLLKLTFTCCFLFSTNPRPPVTPLLVWTLLSITKDYHVYFT